MTIFLPVLLTLVNGDATVIDPSRLASAHAALRTHVQKGNVPGAVTLILHHGKQVHFEAVGAADLEERRPLRRDCLFQVMSMTKPVTAAAVMVAVEQGLLGLDDPVEKYLPQFKNLTVQLDDGSRVPARSRPTLRHLLTHTSGLGSDDPGGMSDGEKFKLKLSQYAERLGSDPLRAHPGTEIRYSGVGFSTLAAIIEQQSGMAFERFVERYVFAPLGMNDTYFFLPLREHPRLAKVYTGEPGRLTRFEHDPFRTGAQFANGAGGLYSTAEDMARFIDSFRSSSSASILSEPARRVMTTLHTGSLTSDGTDARGYGLGWSIVRSPAGQSSLRSLGSFGHTGAFGTEFWHDPSTGITLVYLAQTFLVDESPRRQFSTMVNASIRASSSAKPHQRPDEIHERPLGRARQFQNRTE